MSNQTILFVGVGAAAVGGILALRGNSPSYTSVVADNSGALQSEQTRLAVGQQMFSALAGIYSQEMQLRNEYNIAKLQSDSQRTALQYAADLEGRRMDNELTIEQSKAAAAAAAAKAQGDRSLFSTIGNVIGKIWSIF